MSNQIQNPNVKNKYDLEERTAKFGEDIMAEEFVINRNDKRNPVEFVIVDDFRKQENKKPCFRRTFYWS